MRKIVLSVNSTKNVKSLRYPTSVRKHYFFLVFVTSAEVNIYGKKYLRNKNQLKC